MLGKEANILVPSYQELDTTFVLKILTGEAPMQWAALDENVQFGKIQLVPKMKINQISILIPAQQLSPEKVTTYFRVMK